MMLLLCGVVACQAQRSDPAELTLRALDEARRGVALETMRDMDKHNYRLFSAMQSTADVPDVYEVTVLLPPPRYGVGVAEPKAWAYFVRRTRDDRRVLNEGLMRMALYQGREFHITHYTTPNQLEAAERWSFPLEVRAWLEEYLGVSRPPGEGIRH